MAQLFDIEKVTIGARTLVARVTLAEGAPLMTGEDLDATARVFDLLPGLMEHVCLGDASSRFVDVVENTELAHLLEHVSVELLAQTDIAGDITSGQTVAVGERTFEITLGCPDDVLVAGALSSAVWILQWAYSGGGDPRPDVEAIVGGLVALVGSVSSDDEGARDAIPEAGAAEQDASESVGDDAPAEPPLDSGDDFVQAELPFEPMGEPVPEEETQPALDFSASADGDPEPAAPAGPAPADEPQPAGGSASSAWDIDGVPRPHLVR